MNGFVLVAILLMISFVMGCTAADAQVGLSLFLGKRCPAGPNFFHSTENTLSEPIHFSPGIGGIAIEKCNIRRELPNKEILLNLESSAKTIPPTPGLTIALCLCLIFLISSCISQHDAQYFGPTLTNVVKTSTITIIPSEPRLSETQTPTITTPSGGEQTVTLDDDRKTITLRVGEHLLLKLGDTLNWKVTVGDESIVGRVPNVTVVKGTQGIYEAKKAGETNLDAAGSPICEPQAPCPSFVRAFRVRIEVR